VPCSRGSHASTAGLRTQISDTRGGRSRTPADRVCYVQGVWTRGAAIRPVPRYAVISKAALRRVEDNLAEDATSGHTSMDGAFERFEETQPEIAARLRDVLDRPLDETALALGYFLSIAIWLAFDHVFSARLRTVTGDAWSATAAALALEEDLRKRHADEPLDLDDVLALEQPDVLAFVHEHIDAALETGHRDDAIEEAADCETRSDVDVDDVAIVYRAILALTLALSHAVEPDGAEPSPELMA